MSTQVTRTPHDALGLSADDLLSMYRIDADRPPARRGRPPPEPHGPGAVRGARLAATRAVRSARRGRCGGAPTSGSPTTAISRVVLVAGMTPYEVFLGIFAKADDPSSGGRQMPSHWGSRRLGIISGSSPIATQVPHAAGIAYAVKYRGEDAVVACWFGDGATSEGDWHEGLNFAGIHRLPVVFVCENNHYAISVPQSKQMAVEDVADRAAGYGFPGVVVDGNDVLGVLRRHEGRRTSGRGPARAPR